MFPVDDKCSIPFKTYLHKEGVYNFVKNIVKESKYCSDVIKRHFNKELVMTKEENENFKKCTKCWICDNDYVDNVIKVRDTCHFTGKYRGSADRDCNVNLKLNHKFKITIVFHNLKNYDSHLII